MEEKKYYYMRLKENFFDDESMKILEALPDGYLYSNILLKMYLSSLKYDGRLMLNNLIPYNANMIASITRHQVGTVQKALEIFAELGLIEVLDNGAIYMMNIQNFIGKSSDVADRQREYDRKIALERKETRNLEESLQKSLPEIEIKKELKTELKLNNINYQKIVDMYNETCLSLPKLLKLSEGRKKAIKNLLKDYSEDDIQTVFEKAEDSDFLTGKTGWSGCGFDWLMKPANFLKTLEGNYDNKTKKKEEMKQNKAEEDLNRFYSGVVNWAKGE